MMNILRCVVNFNHLVYDIIVMIYAVTLLLVAIESINEKISRSLQFGTVSERICIWCDGCVWHRLAKRIEWTAHAICVAIYLLIRWSWNRSRVEIVLSHFCNAIRRIWILVEQFIVKQIINNVVTRLDFHNRWQWRLFGIENVKQICVRGKFLIVGRHWRVSNWIACRLRVVRVAVVIHVVSMRWNALWAWLARIIIVIVCTWKFK